MRAAYRLGQKDAALRHGLGALTGALAGVGTTIVLSKPLQAEFGHALYGDTDGLKQKGPIPDDAKHTAKRVATYLRRHDINPEQARIGMVAAGGTGKSTLARALADELKMRHEELDWSPHKLLGDRIQAGSVAEHYELLKHTDPEQYDALIHLAAPMQEIETKLLARGRGAMQLEILDYPKMTQSIAKDFDTANGGVYSPKEGIRVKVRPAGGYGLQKNTDATPWNKNNIIKGFGITGAATAAGALLGHYLK